MILQRQGQVRLNLQHFHTHHLMCHHLKGAIALMEVALKNELVEEKLLDEHLEEWESRSDTVWEQHMWFKFRQAINRPDNVVLFSPETRGPDT